MFFVWVKGSREERTSFSFIFPVTGNERVRGLLRPAIVGDAWSEMISLCHRDTCQYTSSAVTRDDTVLYSFLDNQLVVVGDIMTEFN